MSNIQDVISATLQQACHRPADHLVAEAAWHTSRQDAATPDQQVPAFLERLRRDGLTEAANAIVAALGAAFTDQLWAVRPALALAEQRRAWGDVLALGTRLHELAPDQPDGRVHAALALSRLGRAEEAEQQLATLLTDFPGKAPVLKAAATAAENRRDYELALTRWAHYLAKFPNSKAGFISTLQIVQRTRRLDLIGNILEQAEQKFPKDRRILQLLAAINEREGRWQEAENHWRELVALFPNTPEFALGLALVPLSNRTKRRKLLPEVLARLDGVHERFAGFVQAYVAHVRVLRDAQRPEEAERLASAWCAAFPDHLELALARVHAAEDNGRFADALAQLHGLRARAPATAELESALIRVLSLSGQHDEAEAACARARAAYPRDRDILSEYARIASRRGDMQEALARWNTAGASLPADRRIARERSLLRLELAEQDSEGAVVATSSGDNLFARFESLGGTATGCEFGMVQRKFGSEGIGLLRWTKSGMDDLVAALEQDFEGVGEEANTRLSTVRMSADREEYVTADTRFGMESHTFMKTSDVPADKFFVQTCRRLRFLRDKLMEDLKAAERIFVFKVQEEAADRVLRRLFKAARRHGDVTLLCVMVADDRNPRGSVRVIEPGLMAGYVGHFLKPGDGNARGIDFVTWKVIAQEAELLRARPVAHAA
jgi:tetratricopeptide (TPR) repeat protein